MKLFRLCTFVVVVGAAAACGGNTDGTITTLEPLAGLRYVNLVPDTGGVDFRVIDVVSYAPNQVNAAFRTGGAPYGLATAFMPPHQPVLAGTRQIRVFMYGTTAAIASQVLLDTTYTFTQGVNYTFYMYGYSRPGGNPSVRALITADTVPATLATNKIAVRLIHLANTIAPNAEGLVSAWVVPTAATAPLTGSATFANRMFGEVTGYTVIDTSAAAGYKVAVTATGTATPILFSANMPAGTKGTSSANPIAGTNVAGTSISAVIVPRSVAGSQATSYTTPSVLYLIDGQPPRTAP